MVLPGGLGRYSEALDLLRGYLLHHPQSCEAHRVRRLPGLPCTCPVPFIWVDVLSMWWSPYGSLASRLLCTCAHVALEPWRPALPWILKPEMLTSQHSAECMDKCEPLAHIRRVLSMQCASMCHAHVWGRVRGPEARSRGHASASMRTQQVSYHQLVCPTSSCITCTCMHAGAVPAGPGGGCPGARQGAGGQGGGAAAAAAPGWVPSHEFECVVSKTVAWMGARWPWF